MLNHLKSYIIYTNIIEISEGVRCDVSLRTNDLSRPKDFFILLWTTTPKPNHPSCIGNFPFRKLFDNYLVTQSNYVIY